MFRYIYILILLVVNSGSIFSQKITVFSPDKKAKISFSDKENESVKVAINDLEMDIEKVNGRKLSTITSFTLSDSPTIYIGTITNKDFTKKIKSLNVDISTLKNKYETFFISTPKDDVLLIAGSDDFGTMYGIYEFSNKYLGIDPMYYFSDYTPEKRDELILENVSIISKEPTVKYRGWFINDEDLLSEWGQKGGRRNIDYPFYTQVTDTAVMDKIVEALIRNKFNLIIPASFIDILNPDEEALVKIAARRGAYVSQHHVEPLGVSGFTFFNYWKAKDGSKPVYSFYSSRDKLIEVWKAYAKAWSKYPNVIWQIGLRGIGDNPMWTADKTIPESNEERGKLISDALKTQVEIIKEVDQRKHFPMTITLWGEGAGLYDKGFLKMPADAIIVFSDNCPGWKFQNDFYNVKRDPETKYGAYYHLQLWGSGPHLAQGIPPKQTYKVFKEALDKHSDEYIIMNVSNVREFILGIKCSGDMLYDFQAVNSVDGGLDKYCSYYYSNHKKNVKKLYNSYFNAFQMQKKRNVPFFLDGMSQQYANMMLGDIKKIMKDPSNFKPADSKRKNTGWDFYENNNDPFYSSLGDMNPGYDSIAQLRQAISIQIDSFRSLVNEAELLLPSLSEDEQGMFEQNLLAPTYIMFGLSQRLQYMILAREALDRGNFEDCLFNLKLSREALNYTDRGKILSIRDRKWKDWYRGEKKMNLNHVKKETDNIINKIDNYLNTIGE